MTFQTTYWRFANYARCIKIVGVRQYVGYRFPWGRQTIKLKMLGVELTVRKKSPDLYVALSSLTKEFELFETLLQRDFDGILIDAGGYIGTAAIKMSLLYPQATIVSIEPSSENFGLLSENTESFQNIVVLKAAFSSKGQEKVSLKNRGTGQWGLTIIENPDDSPSAPILEEVDVLTIDMIRKMFPGKEIGAVKLDIEGAEKKLFTDDCEDLRSIPIVFAELHDRVVEGCSDAFHEFSKDRWIIFAGGEKYLSLNK